MSLSAVTRPTLTGKEVAAAVIAGFLAVGAVFFFVSDFLYYGIFPDDGFLGFTYIFVTILSPLLFVMIIIFVLGGSSGKAALFLIPFALKWLVYYVLVADGLGSRDSFSDFLPLFQFGVLVDLGFFDAFVGLELMGLIFQFNLEPLGLIAMAVLLLTSRSGTPVVSVPRGPQHTVYCPACGGAIDGAFCGTCGQPSPAEVPAATPAASGGLHVPSVVAFAFSFAMPLLGLIAGYSAQAKLRERGGPGGINLASVAVNVSWSWLGVLLLFGLLDSLYS
jgi:hypothetical protein